MVPHARYGGRRLSDALVACAGIALVVADVSVGGRFDGSASHRYLGRRGLTARAACPLTGWEAARLLCSTFRPWAPETGDPETGGATVGGWRIIEYFVAVRESRDVVRDNFRS
jgi:hypothetical protein